MRWGVLVAALAALAFPGAVWGAPGCPGALVKPIPPRAASAVTGSGFAKRVARLSDHEREVAAVAELLAGNVPPFLRTLRPVTVRGSLPIGDAVSITFCVMPDYLAIGSSEDFLRIPLGLKGALAVADAFGFVLPTPEIVDAIYTQADIRLRPQPLPPGDRMRSTPYLVRHERLISEQLAMLGVPPGTFLAGHKKDLALTNRLRTRTERVAIYGWHRGDGQPIQPLSTVHGSRYADYSHGVRLVSAVVYVVGRSTPISVVLADPQLAPLLSREGPIPRLAELIDLLRGHTLTMPTAH